MGANMALNIERVRPLTELLLKLSNISWHIDGRSVLDGVDLSLQRGQITTIIGPNGAGKTCLTRIALGLMPASSGKRWLAPNLRIGYVPQRFPLNPYLPLTVADFLALPGPSGQPSRFSWLRWPAPRQKYSQGEILSALREVGAEHLLSHAALTLSGGEQQRVLLARALLRKPDLLVLDEPVQGVDLAGQNELYALIRKLRDRHGCGVLMVSHDLHVVMAATDQVVCLNRHVCCTGHPEAVSKHPEYQRLFGASGGRDLAIYTHHHDHHHSLQGDATDCDTGCKHD